MKKQFLISHHSATFASPGTPNHEERGAEIPKGWSSERVPLSRHSSHNRQVNTTALLPFSSGRTLPSKWDDAERWISSPVLGQEGSYGSKSPQLIQPQRRAKSKSGPLGPQMLGNYGNYSPLMPVIYGTSFTAMDSPLLGSSMNSYGGRRSCPGQNEQELACTREWLKLLNEQPSTGSQEEKSDVQKEDGRQVTSVISRRDMGTQMLPPDGSYSSPSPTQRSPISSPPPPAMDAASNDPPEMDVTIKEVMVDKEDTCPIKLLSKHKRKSRIIRSSSAHDSNIDTITDSRLPVSKLEREEAKINAWENLQREQAEAAIRKLEMKLEKKRSRSMEKILKKLKWAESKAEKMKSSISDNSESSHQVCRKTSQRIAGLCRRIQRSSIANCLACY